MSLSLGEQEILSRFVRLARTAGRVRLEVPSLRFDAALAREIETRVAAQPGIVGVAASPRSARVLIEYAPAAPILADLERLAEEARRAPPAPRRSAPAQVPPALADAHALAVDDVVAQLSTCTHQGLAVDEVEARQHRWGPNLVEPEHTRRRSEILVAQFANLPTALLLGSAALSLVLGDVLEAGAIGLVVGVNAAIGYRIEQKNEELLASWRKLEAGAARVIRGGDLQAVPAADLVPGDLLVVRAGDVTPADARVVDAHRLTTDEAALTGESEPQKKWPDARPVATPLAERTSLLLAGTTVASGHGRAIVVATGAATEMARVRALVGKQRTPGAPLEKRMNALVGKVTWLGLGASVVSAVGGLLHGRPPVEMARNAVALGVAAIPEGLPVTTTATLVRTMRRMRQHGMIVRRVAAAETLGGVTVVCADKTGTLTRNEMVLERLEVEGRQLVIADLRANAADPLGDPGSAILAAAVLNSDVDLHGRGTQVQVAGSSTERAIVEAAYAAGLDGKSLKARFPRRELRERREGVHYVVSLHDIIGDGTLAFIKGAPEQVVPRCARSWRGPLDADAAARLLARNHELAEEGLRVLAVGMQRQDAGEPEDVGWTFLGLVALRDPLREGAAQAIKSAARAGIRTLILTGDQRATAAAIARECGLEGEAIDGVELVRALQNGEKDVHARLARIAVLSRVTPADKLAIVEALRARGEIVAMCGDGINDAPALKAADVGVAVGAGASDMARQTADVVLENEDLRSILAAVGEGRIVQDNLRRATRFLLATNLSEICLVLGGALFGRDPLSPMQLLWINLLTDTLPALALALEEGDPRVLDRAPAPPDAPLLDRREWWRVGRDGALLGALGGAAFAGGGSTAAFATLTAAQFSYAAACRAPDATRHDRFAALVGGSALLQLGALTLAPLRGVLRMPAPGPLALAGFGVGLVLPWAFAHRGAHEIVVQGGAS
jgi:Ca2+-transporting ATPase